MKHIDSTPPQQQPNSPQPKITKNDFRLMVNKEKMLNGKSFENCSRLELFEMIMSLAKAVGEQSRTITKMEADKPLNRIKAFFKKLKTKFHGKAEKRTDTASNTTTKTDN